MCLMQTDKAGGPEGNGQGRPYLEVISESRPRSQDEPSGAVEEAARLGFARSGACSGGQGQQGGRG